MTNQELRTAIRAINADFDKLTTNRYHSMIPLSNIDNIITDHGFDSPTGWTKPITGPSGQSSVRIYAGPPEIFVHISWYKMSSGNFEVIVYCETDIDLPLPSLSTKEKNKAINNVNKNLRDEITHNKYHSTIPIMQIAKIIEVNGFDDSKVGQGIFVGATGKIHVSIGSGAYLTMSWYRMESGRYEITAYAS